MKILKYFFIISILSSCNSINRLYIKFGDAKQQYDKVGDGVIRIYFDRNGFIYPDYSISDKDIRKNNSLLQRYYEENPKVYEEICKNEGVMPHGNLRILNASNGPLQAKLIQNYLAKINASQFHDSEIVFIIHGFNDHPTERKLDNSKKETDSTISTIKSKYPNRTFLFIEIFWDGMSRENGFHNGLSYGLNSFKIWNNSQVSATYSGLELRRILSKVDRQKIFIVTHSHGAALATNSLFNVYKFKDSYYDGGGLFILERYNDVKYDSPKQEFHIGMLAPAIPGQNVFDDYFGRTDLGREKTDKTAKNYHFILGFDHYDQVTRKFYTNSSWFGSTTLACRYSELSAAKKEVGNDASLLDSVDFSRKPNGKRQNEHSWMVYLSNTSNINTFLNKVFN